MIRLYYLLVYCLFSGLGLPALYAAGPEDIGRNIISPEAVLARATELGLTAEQRQAVIREQRTHRDIVAAQLAIIRHTSMALGEQLSLEKPDEDTVLARFEELNAAETVLKRARLTTTVRLKHILTAPQLTLLQSTLKSAPSPLPDFSRGTIQEMLQQVRTGIAEWRKAGRDLTAVNAMWDRFRRHAEAREHAQARQTLQELMDVLSAPPPAQPP